jgi:dihydroneopterin aldolase
VRVELHGLELYAFHGVLPVERGQGQRFLVDVRLEPRDASSGRTDDIADAVDYRTVVAVVQEISGARAFHLLEALAVAIAEALLARLPLVRVEVTVRKPDVVLAVPVQHAAVTVERYSETDNA